MEYFILWERLNLCTEKRKRAESAAGWGAAGSAISIWLQHSTSALHPPVATLRQAASSPECLARTPLPAPASTGLVGGAAGSTGGGQDQPRPPCTAWQPHASPLPCRRAPSELSALWHQWAAFLPPSSSLAQQGQVGRRYPGTATVPTGCQSTGVWTSSWGTALGKQRRSSVRPSPEGSAA